MNRLLVGLLFLASCAHQSTESAPPAPPTPPTPPPPMRGEVVSLKTGTDLQVVVSFHNDGTGTCQIASYALAWGGGPDAVRHACTEPVTVGPGATAEATCLVPDASPLREAAGRIEANLEVVDVSSTCQSSSP